MKSKKDPSIVYIENGKTAASNLSVTKKSPTKNSSDMPRRMIEEFDRIPITDEMKPRVRIVGEILVKFLPAANNYLAELLESEGAGP